MRTCSHEDIEYIIADPAGNITVLVLTEADRADYRRIARELLRREPAAEQVGFVIPGRSCAEAASGSYGSAEGNSGACGAAAGMEMCGLEFCGNASRSYAYYLALQHDPPLAELDVTVSGCDHPLHAWVDTEKGISSIEMPMPLSVTDIVLPAEICGREIQGSLVDLSGITHLVIDMSSDASGDAVTEEVISGWFTKIRTWMYANVDADMPAFGCMFCDTEDLSMIPAVYVRDVDTTYFEGSCASGAAAAACVLASRSLHEDKSRVSAPGGYTMPGGYIPVGEGTSVQRFTFRQPAGELAVTVSKGADGEPDRLVLSGAVSLSAPIHACI